MAQEETEHLESQNLWGRSIFLYSKKKRREKYFRRMMKTQKDFESGFLKKAKLKYIEM